MHCSLDMHPLTILAMRQLLLSSTEEMVPRSQRPSPGIFFWRRRNATLPTAKPPRYASQTEERGSLIGMRGFESSQRLSLGRKALQINWGLILIVTAIAAIGVAMLYSAANGSWNPRATRQIAHGAVGLVI